MQAMQALEPRSDWSTRMLGLLDEDRERKSRPARRSTTSWSHVAMVVGAAPIAAAVAWVGAFLAGTVL